MKSILLRAKVLLFAFVGCLLLASPLFAKGGSTTTESGGGEGTWVLSYFLTGLSIVLGMLVVCLGSTRRDRERPEGYTENKVGIGKEHK
jgi:hypothetical protein